MSVQQDMHDFLDECNKASGTFYLVTIDDGKPACRPVGFHLMDNDIEYFGVGTFKDVYKQIEANPAVQIVGCKGADWIRISGTAVIDKDEALIEKCLDSAPFLRTIYNEETGNEFGAFHLKDATVQYYEQLMNLAKTDTF